MIDELLAGDPSAFIRFMKKNDNTKTRKALLKSDWLKLLYCLHVCCRESVFNSIDVSALPKGSNVRCVEAMLKAFKEECSKLDVAVPKSGTAGWAAVPVVTLEMEKLEDEDV